MDQLSFVAYEPRTPTITVFRVTEENWKLAVAFIKARPEVKPYYQNIHYARGPHRTFLFLTHRVWGMRLGDWVRVDQKEVEILEDWELNREWKVKTPS